MIEKLKKQNTWGECLEKLNEVIDDVNAIQKEREAERFEIQEWIGIVSDLRSRVPVAESRISILEEHAHPTATTEPADPYAEQRKWIGKLCWFWKYDDSKPFADLLSSIDDTDNEFPYYSRNSGYWCKKCEPVKPDDDIIYKGE